MAADPQSHQCPCSFLQHSWAGQSSWKHFKRSPPLPCPSLGSTWCSSGIAQECLCRSKDSLFTSVAKAFTHTGTCFTLWCLRECMNSLHFFRIHWWDYSWCLKKTYPPPKQTKPSNCLLICLLPWSGSNFPNLLSKAKLLFKPQLLRIGVPSIWDFGFKVLHCKFQDSQNYTMRHWV